VTDAAGRDAVGEALKAGGLKLFGGPGQWTAHPDLTDLVAGVIPRGVGMIVGAPGAGKTLVAVDLACHLAGGRTWLGRKTHGCPCIYVATEAPVSVDRRFIAWAVAHGMDAPPPGVWVVGGEFSIGTADQMNALMTAAKQSARAGIFIIDTFANACAGADENSAGAMTALLRRLSSLNEETGWTVLFLHHQAKGQAYARGSSAIGARCDFSLAVEKREQGISVKSEKLRDLPPGLVLGSFAVEAQHIGRDAEGDPINVPAVRNLPHASVIASLAAKASKGDSRTRALRDAVRRSPSPMAVEALRQAFYSHMDGESPAPSQEVKKKAFSTTLKRCVQSGDLKEAGDGTYAASSGKREGEVESGKPPPFPCGEQEGESGKGTPPSLEGGSFPASPDRGLASASNGSKFNRFVVTVSSPAAGAG